MVSATTVLKFSLKSPPIQLRCQPLSLTSSCFLGIPSTLIVLLSREVLSVAAHRVGEVVPCPTPVTAAVFYEHELEQTYPPPP